MSLVKITFDGSSVSAKRDADINYHLTGLVAAGIIRGLGAELSYSVSNNYITFQDGYVQIYGRRIYVEAGTSSYVSLDSTKYGYVAIQVSLSSNSVNLIKKESSSGYPSLIQENLATGGNTYEMPLARYTKTATSLTIDTSFTRTFIETPLSVASSGLAQAKTYMADRYGTWVRLYATESTATTWKYTLDWMMYQDAIIFVNINDSVLVPVTGRFIDGHSNGYLYYVLDGTCYKLGVSKLDSVSFMFSTSTSNHKIKSIQGIR